MISRPAAAITLAYLGLTLPLAVLGWDRTPTASLQAVAHVLLMVVMGTAAHRERSGWRRTALDWAPLLAIPFLYAELPLLMRGFGGGYHDAAVQRWESAVFGVSPAVTLARRLPTRWISEPLHLAYLSYYAIIYGPALLLASRRRRPEFLVMGALVLLAFAACFSVFVIYPVQGPRYLWPAAHVPDGPIRGIVVALLERGSSRGAAFPSSHVAVAVVQAALMWRFRMRGAGLVTVLTLGLAIGAVYGGFHYAIDAVAGAATGLAVIAAAPRVHRRVSPEPPVMAVALPPQ